MYVKCGAVYSVLCVYVGVRVYYVCVCPVYLSLCHVRASRVLPRCTSVLASCVRSGCHAFYLKMSVVFVRPCHHTAPIRAAPSAGPNVDLKFCD